MIRAALLGGLALLAACRPLAAEEISRAEAVAIARQEIRFEPVSIEAVKTEHEGTAVWKVTLRGNAGPHPMGPLMIVVIDRRSGAVLALTRT